MAPDHEKCFHTISPIAWAGSGNTRLLKSEECRGREQVEHNKEQCLCCVLFWGQPRLLVISYLPLTLASLEVINYLLLSELLLCLSNHFSFLYFSKIFLPVQHLWRKRSDLLGSPLPLDPTNSGIFFPCCFLHVVSLLSLCDLFLSSSVQFRVCWSQSCWQVQE